MQSQPIDLGWIDLILDLITSIYVIFRDLNTQQHKRDTFASALRPPPPLLCLSNDDDNCLRRRGRTAPLPPYDSRWAAYDLSCLSMVVGRQLLGRETGGSAVFRGSSLPLILCEGRWTSPSLDFGWAASLLPYNHRWEAYDLSCPSMVVGRSIAT